MFDQLGGGQLAARNARARHHRVDFALGAAIAIVLLIRSMELQQKLILFIELVAFTSQISGNRATQVCCR